MNTFRLGVISIIFSIGLLLPSTVSASDLPTFPSCLNPQGNVIASYSSGTHGIVGQDETFTGRDTVYKVSDQVVTQCFCPASGTNGIQTDWMKVSQLSQEEVSILLNAGWTYITSGSVWGLEDVAYIAKNSSFSCGGGTGGSSTSSSNDAVAGASATNNPTVQAALSLATTGNLQFIFILLGLGILSFVLGVYLRKTAK